MRSVFDIISVKSNESLRKGTNQPKPDCEASKKTDDGGLLECQYRQHCFDYLCGNKLMQKIYS